MSYVCICSATFPGKMEDVWEKEITERWTYLSAVVGTNYEKTPWKSRETSGLIALLSSANFLCVVPFGFLMWTSKLNGIGLFMNWAAEFLTQTAIFSR